MSTRIASLFGVLIAFLALAPLAHAKPNCGKVGKIKITSSSTENKNYEYASVEINGVTYENIGAEQAQLAASARFAGRDLCATTSSSTPEGDMGPGPTTTTIELNLDQ